MIQNKLIYFPERLGYEFIHSLSSGAEVENECVYIYIYIYIFMYTYISISPTHICLYGIDRDKCFNTNYVLLNVDAFYHILLQLIYIYDQSFGEFSHQERSRCVFMKVSVRKHCTFHNYISWRGEIYCSNIITITTLM